MPSKVTFDTVREMGLALPGVEDSTSYGVPSLKVHGKLMTCPAINKSAEPGSIAVFIDFDQRDAMIAEEPDVYYVTDHYANGPCVLVRLARIRLDALRDLIRASWQFVGAQVRSKKKRSPRQKRTR